MHLTWSRFEVLAVVLGLGGGAVIGGLWYFAPFVLAALPDASDLHYHFTTGVPWSGYVWESIWQQLAKSPPLALAASVLVILMILRPLLRFFGDAS